MKHTDPIFIGGLFKSGTTLFRIMLGQHSKLASGLETYWFEVDWNDLDGEVAQKRLRWLTAFYETEEQEMLDMVAASSNIGEFITALLDRHTERLGKDRWVEKTPGNILHVRRLFELWPTAKMVHIIRDPRDVYASVLLAGKWEDWLKPEFFAERWCESIGAAEDAKANPPWQGEKFKEIRYEDLILNTEDTMRGVLDFLGEPWEDNVAQFEGQTEDYEKVLRHTGKSSTTLERIRKPISDERIGLWPKVVDQDKLARLEVRIEELGLAEAYARITAASPRQG